MPNAARDALVPPHTAGVSAARSIFNFITLIIGGGLLGWPSIFRLCGWAGGSVCLCVVCLFAESTMCLMVRLSCSTTVVERGGPTWSYEKTCSRIWGRTGYYTVAATCWLMDFGVLITYWVALGDLLSPLAAQTLGWEDKVHVQLAMAVLMLPPCFSGNLGKLPGWAYVSYGLVVSSLVCMFWLCLQPAVVDYNRDHVEPVGEVVQPDWRPIKDELWPSLGTLAFTFCNHDSVFMIYQSLSQCTWQRWSFVCKVAMWSTVVLMVALGLPIYFLLGDKTASDVTTNFPDSLLMRAVRLALAVTIAMSCIYLQQVARKYLHSMVMPIVRGEALADRESYRMTPCELVVFTTVQFAATLVLGVWIGDLGLPMALTGVFAQSLAAYVIPPLLLLTVLVQSHDNVGCSRAAQAYFVVVLLFGLASCTLGVFRTIQQYSV